MKEEFKNIVAHNIILIARLLQHIDVGNIKRCMCEVNDVYYFEASAAHVMKCIELLDDEITVCCDEINDTVYTEIREYISIIRDEHEEYC